MRTKKGFTLIELVIGMVVLAIAMMIMNTMLISQSKDALEPLYRLRASQLGQSILQNILSRSYDENSDHNGGYYRCGETWTTYSNTYVSCTSEDDYGIDSDETEGAHQNFNDVDDFVTCTYSENKCTAIVFESAITYGDVFGGDLTSQQYANYAVKIEVVEDTTTVSSITMKRIDVTVKTPSDEQIVFSALKGNY